MKIVVMGTGGVGGYFGARLAAAADGGSNDVTFVARGAHKEAIERGGLRVLSAAGDLRLHPARVVDDQAGIGPCDAVLVAVKLWDTEAAATLVRPLLADDTAVVSLQNGVEKEDALARLLGPEHVLGGVAYISAVIQEPGVIRHNGIGARLIFGERDGRDSRRQEALLAACLGAGIDARASRTIDRDIWEKFVFLAPLAGATAFARQPIGPVLDDPAGRARFEALVGETAAVGRAKGVGLPPELEERTIAFTRQLPGDTRPSMLVDLERGNRLELDWLTGAVVRLGRDLGVPTPASEEVYGALRPYALGRPPAG